MVQWSSATRRRWWLAPAVLLVLSGGRARVVADRWGAWGGSRHSGWGESRFGNRRDNWLGNWR